MGVAAFVLSISVPASAQAGTKTVQNCSPGNVCLYKATHGPSVGGSPFLSSVGGFSKKSYAADRIFNNGVKYPKADHIRYWGKTDNGVFQGCLHFNESTTGMQKGSWADLTKVPGARVQAAYWGDECAANEPVLEALYYGTSKWFTLQ
ncbi:hypothetical protein [Streptomyces alkaliterrae]|uniref:Peptidase inhibitor family I36 protein n=1 Tax=Streptomyces alkaliterrae TaxID=2213162 RepID=A0A5P0YLA8_9ACTN|nr:hypothetical protein [Streptomyces alkaliterrae]MBB1252282.1 hypothetical protein [Streptomyces alkaliterrae]MBB1257966.1 hypothetical protein [Streptomyces alkaliterrae]MQS01154.1 hypothetical protein [Streptomyces alkaliterrae]